MKFYSLNNKSPEVSYREAVLRGLAPDGGLYFPKTITPLPTTFFKNINQLSDQEIAFTSIKQFVGDEIPDKVLEQIISETLCFDFPYKKIEDNLYVLELFHGPTMAFKDIGARFMARCLSYFNTQKKHQKVTVLVATSGDTGSAVAKGFYQVEGVEVVILYPSGKVSDIQEKQFTTLGENITALEVDGTFDDCQKMVKEAFVDEALKTKRLTSANSINIARWLPQMFYFLITHKAIGSFAHPLSFVVPSGNFGNICSGIIANKLGMPVQKFISATNINDTVPRYMISGKYEPKASKQTISNAMDVGDPSNFIRIQKLFNNNFLELKTHFSSYSYTDDQTKKAMREMYEKVQYVADPHGAVAYLAAKDYQLKHPDQKTVFLETAHPAKFLNIVESTLQIKLNIPSPLKSLMENKKKTIKISSFENLKQNLLDGS